MRSPPEDDADLADLAQLNAEPWMVDALNLNPSYPHWGPDEDYMACGDDAGLRSPIRYATWADMEIGLDDLNECANFYYEIRRDSRNCEPCDRSGSNPATKQIADDFYDFAGRGTRWVDKITEDEAAALIAKGRGHGGAKTAAEFNAQNSPGRSRGWHGHGAINRWILVETRARRLGVYGHCTVCDGKGYVYTAPAARLALVLWVLHPRKGASRGVEIKSLSRDDLRASLLWLKQAAERNADRFAKAIAAAKED